VPYAKWIRRSAFALAALVLASGCSRGGSKNDSATKDTSAPNSFTIWAPDRMKKPLDSTVEYFKTLHPGIDISVVYGGEELNDRLLQGDKPDLLVDTAVQLNLLALDKTIPDERVDFGRDPIVFIVRKGNPKNITNLSVFGFDPLTTSALCDRKAGCGQAGRAVLAKARVTAQPDKTEPDPKSMTVDVANGTVDVGLLYRSQAVPAHKNGYVDYVKIPTPSSTESQYQIAIIRHGAAVDTFIDFVKNSPGVPMIRAQSGLGPLPADVE
jgi:ABC-type molybdate transport system substrate-binding protein